MAKKNLAKCDARAYAKNVEISQNIEANFRYDMRASRAHKVLVFVCQCGVGWRLACVCVFVFVRVLYWYLMYLHIRQRDD